MVQIRPGVAEYDLPRGEEQARVGWGYAARREGPADREQGEGRTGVPRRSWSKLPTPGVAPAGPRRLWVLRGVVEELTQALA